MRRGYAMWAGVLTLVLHVGGAGAAPDLRGLFEIGPAGCVPQGALAALLAEEPSCALDFNACRAAPAVAAGARLPADQVDALATLLTRAEGDWAVRCPADGPRYLFQTALTGLAYAGAADRLDVLLALADPAVLAVVGENVRRLLAEALVWLGDPRAGPALAAMVALPTGNPDFKPIALFGLGRLRDAGAAGTCQTLLAEDADAAVAVACVHYLAAVKAEGALAALDKASGRHPEAVARALATLGGDEARPLLKRLAASGELRVRIAAQVSLLEVGDDTFLGSLTAALQAPERLRRERLERYKKQAKRLKKRKARKGRRGRKKRPAPVAPTRPSKALIKEMAALDLAARVAIECGRVTRPEVADRLDRALWQAARAEYELRWRAHTHALLALAQRGDGSAVARLAEVLAGATDPLRGAAGGGGRPVVRA
ncbi:MAG: hypothetical protein R3F60_02090 [bacterium]